LILGPDGKKMSKRHGATGVHDYEALGYPAPAMRNYLARLGWSHGDQEVFTDDELKRLFDIAGINKAPARFDFKKLESISGHHIARMDDSALLNAIDGFLAARDDAPLSAAQREKLAVAMQYLKDRAKTLGDLLDKAHFVLGARPFEPDEKAAAALDAVSRGILGELTPHLQTANWTRDALEETVASFAEARGMKLGKIAQPLRAALSGRAASPSVFDMMIVIGREETIGRIEDAAGMGGA
jgi:glutamyl-tRNA synthetase